MKIFNVLNTQKYNNYYKQNFNGIEDVKALLAEETCNPKSLIQSSNKDSYNKLPAGKPFSSLVIGISGESGSGKTTMLELIKEFAELKKFPISVLHMDNYFHNLRHIYDKHGGWTQTLSAGRVRIESPIIYNFGLLSHDIEELKKGNGVITSEYNFSKSIPEPDKNLVRPSKLILVEGLYAAMVPGNNFNIYVDCNEGTLFQRQMERSIKRGETKESMSKIYQIITKSAQIHIKPLKDNADLVINGELINESFSSFLRKFIDAFMKVK